MAIWDRLTALIAGGALSRSAGTALDPVFETTRQRAQHERAVKVLDPTTAAEVRAREPKVADDSTLPGLSTEGVNLADDAQRHGIGRHRFNLLTELARTEPGIGPWTILRRRSIASDGRVGVGRDEFRDVLRRQGLRFEWIDKLEELLAARMSPADIANAIQQGFVPNVSAQHPGEPILPPDPGGDPPFAPPVEQVDLDPEAQVADEGMSWEQLKVLAELSGNPPSPEQLAEMLMRGEINNKTFDHGIREGRTKTKWTTALRYYLTHPLLNAATNVNLRLRGYIDDTEYHRRMALRGYSADQANDWFLSAGRPLAPQQMLDLIARKGPSPTGNGVFTFTDFKQGMVESDIKPKYSTPAEALYHKYLPPFQLRRAVEGGGMTKARAKEIMLIERYVESDIDAFLASIPVDSTSPDPSVKKAETHLWNTLHASYKANESDAATVEAGLDLLGVPQGVHARILNLWEHERELIRKQLTPAQIKKAIKGGVINAATGQPWTRDDGLAALVARGYTTADAGTFLDE